MKDPMSELTSWLFYRHAAHASEACSYRQQRANRSWAQPLWHFASGTTVGRALLQLYRIDVESKVTGRKMMLYHHVILGRLFQLLQGRLLTSTPTESTLLAVCSLGLFAARAGQFTAASTHMQAASRIYASDASLHSVWHICAMMDLIVATFLEGVPAFGVSEPTKHGFAPSVRAKALRCVEISRLGATACKSQMVWMFSLLHTLEDELFAKDSTSENLTTLIDCGQSICSLIAKEDLPFSLNTLHCAHLHFWRIASHSAPQSPRIYQVLLGRLRISLQATELASLSISDRIPLIWAVFSGYVYACSYSAPDVASFQIALRMLIPTFTVGDIDDILSGLQNFPGFTRTSSAHLGSVLGDIHSMERRAQVTTLKTSPFFSIFEYHIATFI